ncbi:MAG: hypothetical protein DRN15_11090 [Thermoprotei archaeon]|nr:MAG: hypothetical protein DRN15_11090 [Thermoprotei archaeon]
MAEGDTIITDQSKLHSKELYKNLLRASRFDSIVVSIRMSKKLYNALKKMAEIHSISLNRLINLACIGLVVGSKVELPREKPIAPPIVVYIQEPQKRSSEKVRAKARVIKTKINIALEKVESLLSDYDKLLKYKDRLRGRMDYWNYLSRIKSQLRNATKELEVLLDEAIKHDVGEEEVKRLEEYLTAVYRALGEEAI